MTRGLTATGSVDGLPTGGVSDDALLVWRPMGSVVLSYECPHLKIEIWGTRIGGVG